VVMQSPVFTVVMKSPVFTVVIKCFTMIHCC
jgi:hypothetical protein